MTTNVNIKEQDSIFLGYQGEDGSNIISFDVTDWIEEYGSSGTFTLLNKRPFDEEDAYPCTVILSGNTVLWTVYSADVQYVGKGRAQLTLAINGKIAKTKVFNTYVRESLDQTANPPEPWQGWYDDMMDAIRGGYVPADYRRATDQDVIDAALSASIASKVDKVTGKGLSTNDYTTAEKTKLSGIQAGAQVNPDMSVYRTAADQDDIDESKAEKDTLEKTERSLDALWKVTQGQVWNFDVDNENVYRKTVPSGARFDTVDMIGGMSRIANQFLNGAWFKEVPTGANGVNFAKDNGVITITVAAGGATADTTWQFADYRNEHTPVSTDRFLMYGGLSENIFIYPNSPSIRDYGSGAIFTASGNTIFSFFIQVKNGTPAGTYTVTPKLVDLAMWFGANSLSPSAVSDARVNEVKTYTNAFPAYNATGTTISAKVSRIRIYDNGSPRTDIQTIDIPLAVQNLAGYGECKPNNTSIRNYVDYAAKEYHQVGAFNAQGTWENFATEVVTDISEMIPDGFLENITVVAGGLVEFRQQAAAFALMCNVQNSFIIKLSEVTP